MMNSHAAVVRLRPGRTRSFRSHSWAWHGAHGNDRLLRPCFPRLLKRFLGVVSRRFYGDRNRAPRKLTTKIVRSSFGDR